MKILMATMALGIGGAETHIVELCKQLRSQGHDVIVASNGGVYVDEITAVGIRHYKVPMHRRNLQCMLRSRILLKQIIRDERPDIVHAHARIPAFLCGTLHKTMKFPFVTTAHWVFRINGSLRYLTNWGQRTVAVSEDIKAYLIREYNVPAAHISVTINGIDTEKFSPAVSGGRIVSEFKLDPTLPILSYVSRMDEDRALVARQLIEIAPALEKKLPGIQMVIAGGGNVFQELYERAQEVNAQLGYTCITMTGPRTDISEIVGACEVFVGVSRSALEAMSAEKPVIVAGNEGYQGLFTPARLPAARAGNFCCRGMEQSTPERLLRDVLAAFALPDDAKQKLGAYGREVIFKYYSVHRMAQDCLDMYNQVRRRKHQVLVSGYYGFSNAGDDAILQSIYESIQATSDEIEVVVLSNDPEDTRTRFGMRALSRFHLWTVLRALMRCDALLFGGGSLLQDRTSTRSLLYYLSVIRGAELFGKPVMLYANGIGPVQKPMNRRLVAKAVERASVVTLRDHSSCRELSDMGVTRDDMCVTADPVFNLSPAPAARVKPILQRLGLSEQTPFAVISVRRWPDTGRFAEELAKLCDHLIEVYGLRILFLPMQPVQDIPASERVRAEMRGSSYLLQESATPQELMAILGMARLCVAMRLHTIIFAARMAVPLLGMVYDPKVDSYLDELGMPSVGEVTHFSADEAIEAADALMARYASARQDLRSKSAELAAAARENERLLLQMLETRKQS